MEVNFIEEGPILIAAPAGRVESRNAGSFQTQMEDAISGEKREALVIDMEELQYISSAGLRAVAIMINRTRERGMKLAMCSMSPAVKAVFVTSGFSQLVGIHGSREEALSEVRG